MRKTVEERFWSKVDKTGECWLWTGACLPTGYGAFWHEGKMVYPHRLSYAWANGEIPVGLLTDHRCHDRRCVRPDHMRLVTPGQNSQNRRGATRASTTGVRGVYWSKRGRKFEARATLSGKGFYVGSFDTLEEAEAAVIAKRRELFTHDDYADWATTTEGAPNPGTHVL